MTEVSFHLNAGETLGLVGESGCGKSTTARLLMGLTEPTSGRIVFDGKDITRLNRSDRVAVRRQMQMVYQDPFSSVNPRMTVRDIVMEPMLIHEGVETDPEGRLQYLLEMVGLGPRYKSRYPHQLSGGQLQRVGIARALALDPQILILDEPVSALDVSIQAQILGLLQDLQEELGVAFLFVAHDLGVVRHVSDRVAVMYLGRVVETGTRDQVYESAAHPYTQALLSSVPVADPRMRTKSRRILLTGDPPSPTNIPSGCAFRNRCWRAEDVCAVERPLLESRTGVAHPAACHFASSSLDARQSRGNEGGTV